MERAEPGTPEWAELSGAHVARYLWAAEHAAGRRVLDAACGAGYGAALLRQAGAARVLGIDRDGATIARARARFGADRVEFRQGDVLELGTLAERFDLVVSFETIEHVSDPDRLLRGIGQVLAPGGAALVSTPDRVRSEPPRAGRPANPHHVQEWDAPGFRTLLATHFADVDCRVQVRGVALAMRAQAVRALHDLLWWGNPVGPLLWRLRRPRWGRRPWKELEGLAAGSPGDFPVVAPVLAGVVGEPAFLVAICRTPRGAPP